MIDPCVFYELLVARGTGFFAGVPDSLLEGFCACLADRAGGRGHIIAVNEGAACALAAGYHLATGGVPVVYMQNSGIGNAVNPLLSLADGDVYRIPMVLLVGWRGEPGVNDEPQHLKQGRVTCELFDAMDIPYFILSGGEGEIRGQLDLCYGRVHKEGTPFALIVRKGTFGDYTPSGKNVVGINTSIPDKGVVEADMSIKGEAAGINIVRTGGDAAEIGASVEISSAGFLDVDVYADVYSDMYMAEMSREDAIEEIMRSSFPSEIFISTTGMASRELYELREKYGFGHERDFLTVGSMGHASSIALAVALYKPDLLVNCLDGDGAALMHLGNLAAIGAQKLANLRHIVLNNGAHDSVGGQPTIAEKIDLAGIARSCGYSSIYKAKTKEELRRALDKKNGPSFIEVQVRTGSRKDLGRPKSGPIENKEAFMKFLRQG
jgi:phosphonopyruvate decarboxylase